MGLCYRFGYLWVALSAGVALGAEITPVRTETPLGAGGPLLGVYSERTLVVGFQIDRDGSRVLGYTAKPRPYIQPLELAPPRPAEARPDLQVEVALHGTNDLRLTRRIDLGPLCLLHGPDDEPHVEGDTIRLHQDSFVVELPEIAGFDRVELAFHETASAGLTRQSLGLDLLDRFRFDPAGAPLTYDQLLIFDPNEASPPPIAPSAVTIIWPEDVGDTEIYQVFGDESEALKRINVTILPDGYRYSEKALMEQHAAEMVQHFRGKIPFLEHDPFMNYTLVYAYAAESGTDECDCAIVKDTPFGTRFPSPNPACGHSENRCLYYGSNCDTSGLANIVAAELRPPAHDETILMVNTPRYGGCGGTRAAYSAGNGAAKEIAVHELGHSLGGLNDEYAYNASCGTSAGEVNTSKDPIDGAWPEWIGDIGPPVQGGQYYQSCIYRPKSNCEMRNLNQEFCEVCNQQWSLLTFGHPRVVSSAPIESAAPDSPANTWAGVPTEFSVSTRLSQGPSVVNQYRWTVNGPGYPPDTVLSNDGPDLTHTFPQPGSYELSVRLTADTNFVKPAKYGANQDEFVWQVQAAFLQPPQEISPPGAPVPLRFQDPQTLTWEDGTLKFAHTYNLYRGALSDLGAMDYGQCLLTGLESPTGTDDAEPTSGAGWLYLVTGANPLAEGPLGQTSAGDPRPNGAPCP